MHDYHASLGEQGHNGKDQALRCMGKLENHEQKTKSTKRTKVGAALWKLTVLIGVPSNGKWF